MFPHSSWGRELGYLHTSFSGPVIEGCSHEMYWAHWWFLQLGRKFSGKEMHMVAIEVTQCGLITVFWSC